MKLSVESLRAAGGFTGPPVKREVTWEVDGNEYTADVYVRRLSYHSAVTDVLSIDSGSDLAANRIANCIVDENGKAVFSVSDITGFFPDGEPVLDEDGQERGALCSELSIALLGLIAEVNHLGKKPAAS